MKVRSYKRESYKSNHLREMEIKKGLVAPQIINVILILGAKMENSKEKNGYEQLIAQLVNSNILTNQRVDESMKQIADTRKEYQKEMLELKKEHLELEKKILVMQNQISSIYQMILKMQESGNIGFNAK